MSRGAAQPSDRTAPGRQFVILSGRAPAELGMLQPIGARDDIRRQLADRNTGPENDEAPDVLYGPGIRIEQTPGQDPITQMLVTITEEEIGWLVLTRLIRELRWRLVDPNTGRELSPPEPD